MITHKIRKSAGTKSSAVDDEYDERDNFRDPWMRDQWTREFNRSRIPVTKKFDKLGYAQYLAKLPMKRGDLLMSNYHEQREPKELPPHNFFVVKDIQEIHSHVEYHSMDYAPRCLYMAGLSAAGEPFTPFWGCPSSYIVVPLEEVNAEVRLAYDRAQNKVSQ